ncbi:MAG: O-antigen ligase family protein [Clostridia bacterium]|nr:O-antigen ligase family protein [Clostridia bacterium]
MMPAFLKKAYENKWIGAVRSFVDGPFFPVLLGGFTLVTYLCGLPIFTIAVLFLAMAFILLFCADTRPIIGIVLLLFISMTYRYDPKEYTSVKALVTYFITGAPALFGMVMRFIAFPIRKSKRKLLIGLVGMSVGFIVGGIFCDYNWAGHLVKTSGLVVAFCGTYLFFSLTMEHREDNLLYVARVCAIALCCIAAQLIQIYVKDYEKGMALDGGWKGEIFFGWGISNTAGELAAMFLPAVLYMIYKEKYGYVYYSLLLVGLAVIVFTLCRAALLFGVGVLLVGLPLCAFIGENKKINRWFSGGLLAVLTTLVVLILTSDEFDKFFEFFTENKLNDRGRFKLWKQYMAFFKEEPFFGVGFLAHKVVYPSVGVAWQAHNTPIQVLACTGVFGFALYAFHRLQTVLLFAKKPKWERLFLGACIAVGLLESLLDPLFFRMYFGVYYSVILLVCELSLESDVKKEKEKTE